MNVKLPIERLVGVYTSSSEHTTSDSKSRASDASYARDSLLPEPIPVYSHVKSTTGLLQIAYSYLIRECLDKLVILRITLKETVNPQWTEDIVYREREDRFEREAQNEEDFEGYAYTNNKKLTKDICHIHEILRNTLEQIVTEKNASVIHDILDIIEQENNDAIDLLHDLVVNGGVMHNYTMQLLAADCKRKTLINKQLDQINQERGQYEDTVLFNIMQSRYIDKWEDNRCYLHDFKTNQEEKKMTDEIMKCQTLVNNENRVHDEMTRYYQENRDKNSNDTEEWLNRYEKDMEEIEAQIYELRVAQEKWELDFSLLNKEYQQRSQDMDEWIKRREEIRKRALELQAMTTAATKIQAWWRGVMYRRHLGPYRRKKSRKKDKNKKGRK